ncbi:MAG: putative phospholipid import ATP-binding protein MlaF [Gammaproteobacteria bacterium]|nr:putative phospholipid import ATP-binding protein MlaF [Gammaproteobacteria bacterium]
MSKPLLEINDVHFSFGANEVYRALNLRVHKGQVAAIIGPSGCGKSTLLNFIGGRLYPNSGSVICDGIDVTSLRRNALFEFRKRLGMMFQASALLTDFSVFDNVAFPVRQNTNLSETLIRHLVLMKLEMVGLRGARDLMPAELSGGMARRVALARAIAMDPLLVMYDEPFTGLDPISMGVIVKLIREVNDTLGMTSLVVTHDVREACTIADYMYLLGDGKVIGEGNPDRMRESNVPDVRQFMNGLPDGPVRYHYPAPDYADDIIGGPV